MYCNIILPTITYICTHTCNTTTLITISLPQEHKHWEDSFRVYERGISLFKYPHVEDIWAAYLKQFVERYGGTKLERARDLYEQALSMAPPAKAVPLFLQYAALEEAHGLARHAMEIYARALGVVPKDQRLGIVDVYAARASDFFGVAKVSRVHSRVLGRVCMQH